MKNFKLFLSVFMLTISSCSNTDAIIKQNELRIQDYIKSYYDDISTNDFGKLLSSGSEYTTVFVEDHLYITYNDEYHPVASTEEELINRLTRQNKQFGPFEELKIVRIDYTSSLEDYAYPAFLIDVWVLYGNVQANERITLLVVGSSLSILEYKVEKVRLRVGTLLNR